MMDAQMVPEITCSVRRRGRVQSLALLNEAMTVDLHGSVLAANCQEAPAALMRLLSCAGINGRVWIGNNRSGARSRWKGLAVPVIVVNGVPHLDPLELDHRTRRCRLTLHQCCSGE